MASSSVCLQDYSITDIIRLFDLKATPINLSTKDLHQAQKKFQNSQQKGHLSKETILFFSQALHVLENYILENTRVPSTVPQEKKDQEFATKFNTLYENTVQTNKILEQRSRQNQWFQSEEEPTIIKGKSVDEIHVQMNNMRGDYRSNIEPVSTGKSYSRFFDEDDESEEWNNQKQYISSDPFEKCLKFDDIRRVHRDQLIIPVKSCSDKKASLENYKKERNQDIRPFDGKVATEMIQNMETKKQKDWEQQRERNLRLWDEKYRGFQKNYDILS